MKKMAFLLSFVLVASMVIGGKYDKAIEEVEHGKYTKAFKMLDFLSVEGSSEDYFVIEQSVSLKKISCDKMKSFQDDIKGYVINTPKGIISLYHLQEGYWCFIDCTAYGFMDPNQYILRAISQFNMARSNRQ